MTMEAKKEALKHAAANYAGDYPNDTDNLTALCRAAVEYTEARAAKHGATRNPQSFARPKAGVLVPFGRAKGMDVTEASADDLNWVADKITDSIADPAKERWRDSNMRQLAAIRAELGAR